MRLENIQIGPATRIQDPIVETDEGIELGRVVVISAVSSQPRISMGK
jgi:hypothetical protein